MNFSRLADYLNGILDRYDIPGWQCAVSYKGNLVFSECGGYRDREAGIPMKNDDLFWMYSTTKLTTMTAVSQLLSDGCLRLEDRLSDYLPEFRVMRVKTPAGFRVVETPITIRHLMTMTSGLSYDISPCRSYAERNPNASTEEIVTQLASLPLSFEPGTHFLYSMAHDVLAAVCERITGMRFADYVMENIFLPLGMKDTLFGMTAERRKRLVTQYRRDASGTHSERRDGECVFCFTDRYDSGGAGLSSNAEDYLRLPAALANKGCFHGKQILSPEAIDLLRTPQLIGDAKLDFARWHNRPGYQYALGVRTLVNPENANDPFPPGEFGWDGAAGAIATASPETGIAFCFTMQVTGCRDAYHVIHPQIRNLVFEASLQ